MLRHVIADRQGKKRFYVFYDPMIVRFMDIFIKFLLHDTENILFCVFNKVDLLYL